MPGQGGDDGVVPEQLAMFPAKLVEFVATQPINFIFWVPTVMVNIANLDLLAKMKLERLQKVLFIGEVFPTRHFNYWRRHLPGALFVNLYGPIEITVACTYYIVDHELRRGREDAGRLSVPQHGHPDSQRAEPARQADEQGEICVRGSSLALGYWNNAERTAKAFVQNPLNPHYPGADLPDGRPGLLERAAGRSCSWAGETSRSSTWATGSSWARSSTRCCRWTASELLRGL